LDVCFYSDSWSCDDAWLREVRFRGLRRQRGSLFTMVMAVGKGGMVFHECGVCVWNW
jgi:hypothetical protein